MSEIVQLKSSIRKLQPEASAGENAQSSDLSHQPSLPRLEAIRKELGAKKGKEYWRSLEELADSKEFQELMHREFPENASEWNDPVGRRKFLKLMGASLALAGFTACTRQPSEYIAPYVRQPEEIILGKPLYFATATTINGVATGVLVESHEGRPTKVEGNPDHPASLGSTDLYSQASILSLYDPDRSQTVTYLGDVTTWPNFLAAARSMLASIKATGQPAPQGQSSQSAPPQVMPAGGGLRILTETVTSPSLAYQIQTLVGTTPNTKWHTYEPAGNDNTREGARLAFGSYATAVYDFSKADVIVSLDADFLGCGPASLRYSRDFAAKRRLEHGKQTMSRLYVAESSISSTGSVADNRLPMRPSEVEGFARALAASFGGSVPQANLNDTHRRWVNAVVKDLNAHRGTSLVIAGDSQPPFVHALAHLINQQLGNVGQTITFIEPVEANPVAGTVSLQELVNDINAGLVGTLVILGSNPVYTAPADFNFAEVMKKVPLRIHLGLYNDETSELCHWHIPEAHYLEAWGDARAYNGLVSIIQPLIAPIYSGKTAHEVVAAFSEQGAGQTGYQIIQDYWRRFHAGGGKEPAPPAAARPTQAAAAAQGQASGAAVSSQRGTAANRSASPQAPTTAGAQQSGAQQGAGTNARTAAGGPTGAGAATTGNDQFERFWRKALHDGFIPGTERPTKSVSVGAIQPHPPQAAEGMEIVFRPDPTIHDGRFANNGWLQELPKPITTLVWDNAAIMSPATAARLGVGKNSDGVASNNFGNIGGEFHADLIELTLDGRSKVFPAWIQPGHPNDTITVHLGYGRTKAGRVGQGLGFNAYEIRPSTAQWIGRGLQVRVTGDTFPIVAIQLHHVIDEDQVGKRELVRSGTFDEYLRNPSFATHEQAETPHEPGPSQGTHAQREELHQQPSLYPEYDYSKGYAWGMAIDLNSCIGCHACVVACVAENNIPVVGKDQAARRRTMHWLRVDSYYKGGVDNPETYFQPVPCQHCEKAPCEVVCPVAATAHSAEGLNDMVYNRCVGTRYCSNNCPYKVRRFNFLLYQDFYTASLKMLRNPDVSVRSRGVMEKCTYCVQRIQEAKIESEKQNRRVQDGEVVTACAAACPTEAIVFGDINDTNSRVHKLKNEERNFSLLSWLNTQPRTTYLAAVRNPNPELQEA